MASSTVIGVAVLALVCLLIGYEYVTFEPALEQRASQQVQYSHDNEQQVLSGITHVEEELALLIERMKRQEEMFKQMPQNNDDENDNDAIQMTSQPLSSSSSPRYLPNGPEHETANPIKPWKLIPLNERIGQFGRDSCHKVEKVYFLKTSKTGSTTMANILMRFGYRRNATNFLMGETPNGALFFINGYMPFNEEVCFLGRDIKPRPAFDISYVHMRYNRTAVDRLMHSETRKVTILRDPMDNFMSSWKYYHGLTKEMREMLKVPPLDGNEKTPDFMTEMDIFLKAPWGYLEPWHYAHSAYLFTVNPQLIFFGQPSYLLRNKESRLWHLVDEWIHEIDRDFDHVMILEEIDDSLAVLMLKFCWDIDDMVHLKLNAMTGKKKTLSLDSLKKLKELNWADYRLYNYFKNKLHKEIDKIGRSKVTRVKQQIQDRTDQLFDECMEPATTTGWISNPRIKASKAKNQTCTLIVKDISNYLQAEQINRWKKEYPEWRMSQATIKKKKNKGSNMPDFCGPNENFQDWLVKQEPIVTAALKWPTNQYDTRNFIPNYMDNFIQSSVKNKTFNL